MKKDKFLKFSRLSALWLFWPAAGVVIWGELSPGAGDPLGLWDKALHFTAYFGLAGLATVALGGWRRALWPVLGLILMGGVLEIVQGMTGRDMSFYDEVANTIGVAAGVLLGQVYVLVLGPRRLVGPVEPD